jgi:hypothetical protein
VSVEQCTNEQAVVLSQQYQFEVHESLLQNVSFNERQLSDQDTEGVGTLTEYVSAIIMCSLTWQHTASAGTCHKISDSFFLCNMAAMRKHKNGITNIAIKAQYRNRINFFHTLGRLPSVSISAMLSASAPM